jgi:hypothetical protein
VQFEMLRCGDIAAPLARAWDRLAAGRGLHADLYCSHAWLAAWVRSMGAGVAGALRIPAVLAGDQPTALLPLLARSAQRWEWAGESGSRMRYRPVLAAEESAAEAFGLLAEGIARDGVRDLAVDRLPARDLATRALVAGLRQAGFHTYQRQTSSECMALVTGGWREHKRRFASYDRLVKRMAKRLRPLWGLELDEYGPATGRSVVEGFSAYVEVYDRSWKGPLRQPLRSLEDELVRRTAWLG